MLEKMFAVSVCIGIFMLSTAPSVFGKHDMKGKVHCGHGRIIEGTDISIQGICNHIIRVFNISDKDVFPQKAFPFTLDVQLTLTDDDETVSELTSLSGQIHYDALSASDDITDLVPGTVFTIPGGICDKDVLVNFVLRNSTMTFDRQLRRRVMCDYSALDLELQFESVNPVEEPMDIYISETESLQDALSSLGPIKVTATNAGATFPVLSTPDDGIDLPLLDSGFFAVAFITDKVADMVLTQDACQDMSDPILPEITAADTIVASDYFTNADELTKIDLLTKVKENAEKLDLCGEHVLVMMLDPLHTAWNEQNICNNILTIQIHSTRSCDTIAPHCDIIVNPWTSGGMRAIYTVANKTGTVARMFELEGPSVRMVRMEDDWVDWVGFGRLKLFMGLIKRRIAELPEPCSSIPDPRDQLKDLEGSDVASSSTPLPEGFSIAKNAFEKLQNPATNPAAALTEMQIALAKVPSTSSGSFKEEVEHDIVNAAVQYVTKKAEYMLGPMPDPDMETDRCNAPWELENAQWLLNGKEYSPEDIKGHMISLVHQLAVAVLRKPWTCLENMLKHLIEYAGKIDDDSSAVPLAEFLYETDVVADESPESLARCGKVNKCIKKFKRECEMKHTTKEVKPVAESKDEICKLLIIKKSARRLYRKMGMLDILEEIENNNEQDGRYCQRDALKPESGQITLWTIREDDETGQRYVLDGVPDADFNNIEWRKRAVCRCERCESGDGTSSPKHEDGFLDKDDLVRRK